MNTNSASGHLRGGLALALVPVVVWLGAGCGSDRDESATPATSTAAPDPSRPPAGVRWETWQGIKLPHSGADGPTKTSTGAATGYTRTPQGAALAAIQHSIRLSTAPDTSWPVIARTTLTEGPGKDFWVTNRTLISITRPVDAAATPRVLGYSITAWTPDRAEIAVYTSYPDNSLLSTLTTVSWTYGDWRLVLPDPAAGTVAHSAIATVPANAVHLEAPR
ncbi:hypothetical protein [Nocardia sp. NPDC050435]|uniref:hypothetical protein n=1 Tax=Nocardia sp. NPDC050435 TaxID=3155040 RepID=UPI0033E2DA2C